MSFACLASFAVVTEKMSAVSAAIRYRWGVRLWSGYGSDLVFGFQIFSFGQDTGELDAASIERAIDEHWLSSAHFS